MDNEKECPEDFIERIIVEYEILLCRCRQESLTQEDLEQAFKDIEDFVRSR